MQTIIEQLTNGTIPRTPLLPTGQVIANLTHGVYNVTGGTINVGYLGGGSITKVIGIVANGTPPNFDGVYVPGTQPFNTNFACVLFEMREAGVGKISHANLDYSTGNRTSTLNSDFVKSYRASIGLGINNPTFGEATITNKLINGIAR